MLRGHKVSISTIYRVCHKYGLQVKKNRLKGLTKSEKQAYKNDDLLRGDFEATAPNEKLISDITQLPTIEGKLYISAVFDCYDNACVGLSMNDNMRTQLVINSLQAATQLYGNTERVFHTDRGSQYTSQEFRIFLEKLNVSQSMSYAGSGCHGNAKCESLFGRFKEEAIYGRYKTEQMSMQAVKSLVFRYFMGYWNNRRISHAIGGMPPMLKRTLFFERSQLVA
jgi:transposase InsO family protein